MELTAGFLADTTPDVDLIAAVDNLYAAGTYLQGASTSNVFADWTTLSADPSTIADWKKLPYVGFGISWQSVEPDATVSFDGIEAIAYHKIKSIGATLANSAPTWQTYWFERESDNAGRYTDFDDTTQTYFCFDLKLTNTPTAASNLSRDDDSGCSDVDDVVIDDALT